MKIKFLKPFRLYNPIGDDMMIGEGAIENMKEDYAEWLIDNGFAKEVQESGWWKPKNGVDYYYVNDAGVIAGRDGFLSISTIDDRRFSIGNVFKTKAAAERYRDYLKAIATVRQDEGVMTPREIESAECSNGDAWCISYTLDRGLFVYTCRLDVVPTRVGTIYFNSGGHAQASLDKHTDEWKIIANYDWSRE